MSLDHKRPLTIKEAATILEVHPQKLRRAEDAGLIPRARRTPISDERYWLPEEMPAIRTLLSLARQP